MIYITDFTAEEGSNFTCNISGVSIGVLPRFPKNKWLRAMLRLSRAKVSIMTLDGTRTIKKINTGWRLQYKCNGKHYELFVNNIKHDFMPYASYKNGENICWISGRIYHINKKNRSCEVID